MRSSINHLIQSVHFSIEWWNLQEPKRIQSKIICRHDHFIMQKRRLHLSFICSINALLRPTSDVVPFKIFYSGAALVQQQKWTKFLCHAKIVAWQMSKKSWAQLHRALRWTQSWIHWVIEWQQSSQQKHLRVSWCHDLSLTFLGETAGF